MYKKMLVPLDRSQAAESILPHVIELAKLQGAEKCEVVLLNVCEVSLIPEYYLSEIPLSWQDHTIRCKRSAQQYLSKVEKSLKNAGLNVSSVVLMAKAGEGNPASYIVDYANAFDLILMSTHGRSGLSRWALGSVADKVMRRVDIPIFLTRPR